MNTTTLLAALRAHYVKPTPLADRYPGMAGDSDLLLEEVAAPGTNRRCDLLRIGMWASRGHRIIVHEIKVSRSDFLRELEDPAKAEAWWPYCHEFWIAAPDNLIKPEELPDGWGLMVPPANARSRRFQVRKAAAVKDPKLTPQLLVEIARRVDNARLKQIGELNQHHRDEVSRARRDAATARAAEAVPPGLKRRLDLLEKLEAELGGELDAFTWTGADGKLCTIGAGPLGAALADYARDHVKLQELEVNVDRKAQQLRNSARRVVEALASFPERGAL